MITLTDFEASLNQDAAPEEYSIPLRALWYDANNQWETAHQLVQQEPSVEAYWVHAYLHRKEGDKTNAGYWYNRAEHPFPDCSLNDERNQICLTLLSN